jgi:serine/threonine protein kinase
MNTNTTSAVIGEGAYGCIHKPSLTCKENKIQNYKNKVSKVLNKSKAKIELEEYTSIDNADKSHEYYLGKPVECSVDNTPTNIQAIEKCKKGAELLKNLGDLSLLVMDDGGVNLKDYADIMSNWPATPENVDKTERFFIEFHRIFHGIGVFIEKGILHFDMKPQNIVYIAETGRMNIIDFGLTVSLKDKLAEIEASTNGMARYHWSYPFEFFFLNKNEYETFAKIPKPKKEEYYQSILREIGGVPDADASKAFRSFISFIMDETTDSDTFSEHMSGFYQTLVVELTMKNYKNFIKQSITSVDVYGLGIALLYVLKNTKHLLKEKLHTDLCNLGNSMVSAHLSKRITAPAALAQYETILSENGLMEKYKISFANHKIVQGELIPKNIEQSIDSIKINDVLLNNTSLEKNAVSVDISNKKPLMKKSKKNTKSFVKKPTKTRKQYTRSNSSKLMSGRRD